MKVIDLSGMRFGRLTVVGRADVSRAGVYWLCRCDCGIEKQVVSKNLRNGKTKSCGCLSAELSSSRNSTHGDTKGGASAEYRIWSGMISRCGNKNNQHYGGRGITVCDRWKSFTNFLADMGRRPSPAMSIDRIDRDGNYEPSNCRWATATEQNRNYSRNVLIEFNGEKKTIMEWSEIYRIKYSTLYMRLKRGLLIEEALR